MFKVGDEVVCVDDHHVSSAGRLNPFLRKDSVYKVSHIGICASGHSGVLLEGVQIPGYYGTPSLFRASRFRKVERKTETLTRWLSQPVGDTDKLDKSKRRARV